MALTSFMGRYTIVYEKLYAPLHEGYHDSHDEETGGSIVWNPFGDAPIPGLTGRGSIGRP
jgi:hypothetical protein